MSLLTILLFLYILTKPFYFWSSGLPQISDFILILAFIIVVLSNKPSGIGNIIKRNIHFFLFLIFVIVINLVYSIYFLSGDFNLHSLYYVFDALGIITFTAFFDNDDKSFKHMRIALITSLLCQLIIFALGLGKYYAQVRYMGTFNDPNQFAYYCLLMYSFIYLLGIKTGINKYNFIYLLVTLFLIFESSSTGMLIGAFVFVALYTVSFFRKIATNSKKYLSRLLLFIIVFMISVITIQSFPQTEILIGKIANSQLATRIEEKINKAEGGSKISLWQERGYDRMAYYPYYTIFGAGEGNYARFEKAYHQGELHATIPSILFSYGIIPTMLVIAWGYRKLKGKSINELCIYFALLVESFTLINSRQVLFWVIFLLAAYISSSSKESKK